jgi:pimeloyl-ACP methyl ester carboxylesterase
MSVRLPHAQHEHRSGLCVLVLAGVVLTACGGEAGEDPAGEGSAPVSSSSAPAQLWAEGTMGSMEVVADVSGRQLNGDCSGTNTDAPTVLLEVGMDGNPDTFNGVQDHLASLTTYCLYDRAGTAFSDEPDELPRPVTEVVEDMDAFLRQAADQGVGPPYVLVGHSFGGELAFLYAQAHPDQVAGFLSINPSPPSQTWLARAGTVETEAEMAEYELPYVEGDNEEGVVLTSDESMLTDPLPADLPYGVTFDERCEDLPPPLQEEARCAALLGQLELTMQDLARVGAGGSYTRVEGAGHFIMLTRPDVVLPQIDALLAGTTP